MKACRKHTITKKNFLGSIPSGFQWISGGSQGETGRNASASWKMLWIEHTIITFKFLGSNSSGLMQYWMKQRRFFRNEFFSKKLLIQRLLRYAVGTVYVLNIGFWRSPTIVFEVGFEKSDSKLVSWHQLALLAAVANWKFLCKKITARFKLNLKTDGLDCKMIFKFGSRIERLHSARKQGRRIYNVCICKQCVCLYKHHLRCKTLVGEHPNPWTTSRGCRLF